MDEVRKHVLLISDTSNWYHWGCYGTSNVIKSMLESANYQVTSVGLDQIYSDFKKGNSPKGTIAKLSKKKKIARIVFNGEGTIHGNGLWARYVVSIVLGLKYKYNSSLHVINHSCFDLEGELLELCRTLYEEASSIVTRDKVSYDYIRSLGYEAELGFDCLFYMADQIKIHESQINFRRSLVLSSSSKGGKEISRYIRTNLATIIFEFDEIIMLSGSYSNCTSDERELFLELKEINELSQKMKFVYAENFYEWYSIIYRANLLITGRFHYLMAAIAARKKHVIVFSANTPKNLAALSWVLNKELLPSPFGIDVDFSNIDSTSIVESIKKNFEQFEVDEDHLHDKMLLLSKNRRKKEQYINNKRSLLLRLKSQLKNKTGYYLFDEMFKVLNKELPLKGLLLRWMKSKFRRKKKIDIVFKINTSAEERELSRFAERVENKAILVWRKGDDGINNSSCNVVYTNSVVDLYFDFEVKESFWCCLNFSIEQAHEEGIWLTEYFKKKKVKTFCVQHGGMKLSTISGMLSSRSETLFVWNDKLKEKLEELGRKNILVYDRERKLNISPVKIDKELRIVLATCLHTEYDIVGDKDVYRRYMENVVEALDRLNQMYSFELFYVPHPNDNNLELYEKYQPCCGARITRDLYSLLEKPNTVLISRASTTLEEALVSNNYAIGFDFYCNGPLSEYSGLLNSKKMFFTRSKDELLEALLGCVKDIQINA